jgi:hypothetical protein
MSAAPKSTPPPGPELAIVDVGARVLGLLPGAA